MLQERILHLLQEAGKPSCTWQRRNLIQCELGNAIPGETDDPITETQNHLFNSLYVQTLKDRPELLPALFPAFVVLICDPDHNEVDWSLVG
jgi:hypothetical protein